MSNQPTLKLCPQEYGGTYQFSSPLYMTQGFLAVFEGSALLIALAALHRIQQERVRSPDRADYLQVLECKGTRFWVIDDMDHITFLLPEDY
ncbi:MAG TPA: hypothetical protein VN374_02790 [Desulfitobacteriaceae bacterium]|nr:hypothetical protein [Desulfitobacteriaceae bacterium]